MRLLFVASVTFWGSGPNWEKAIPGFIASGDENYPTHSADEHFKG